MTEMIMSKLSRFQEIEKIGVGRKPLRRCEVGGSFHRSKNQGTTLPILIEEPGKLLKAILAGGRVGHSHGPRVLPDLPAQINQRRYDANCAEQFRQHPDIEPGHDSLKLFGVQWP